MKNITDTINEAVDMQTAIITAQSIIVLTQMISMAILTAGSIPGDRNIFELIRDEIKGFFKNRKLKRIAERLKDDPEIVEYINNPRKPGWRKMLQDKLDDEEIKYINSITRKTFDNL